MKCHILQLKVFFTHNSYLDMDLSTQHVVKHEITVKIEYYRETKKKNWLIRVELISDLNQIRNGIRQLTVERTKFHIRSYRRQSV